MNTGQGDMIQIKFISVKLVNPLREQNFFKIQQNICIIILTDY